VEAVSATNVLTSMTELQGRIVKDYTTARRSCMRDGGIARRYDDCTVLEGQLTATITVVLDGVCRRLRKRKALPVRRAHGVKRQCAIDRDRGTTLLVGSHRGHRSSPINRDDLVD